MPPFGDAKVEPRLDGPPSREGGSVGFRSSGSSMKIKGANTMLSKKHLEVREGRVTQVEVENVRQEFPVQLRASWYS